MIAALVVIAACSAAPPPPVQAVDLERGDPAPYAGTLIPTSVAFACASCVVDLGVARADLERNAAEAAARLLRVERERDAERSGRLELASALSDAQAACTPSVVDSPILWGGLGVVVGVGLTLLIVYAVGEI